MDRMHLRGAEAKLAELGMILPKLPPATGAYQPHKLSGGLLFVAGQGPFDHGKGLVRGSVGLDVSVEDAYAHAALAGLSILAVVRDALGSLDRVSGIAKVTGFVNAVPGFRDHPAVIDGCSNLFLSVFGERGRHARTSLGISSLPGGLTVEIDAVFEV